MARTVSCLPIGRLHATDADRLPLLGDARTAAAPLQAFKPKACLGDAIEFEQHQQQQRVAERPEAETGGQVWLRSIDPSSIPQPIWNAAHLLGDDRGVVLLRYYTELQRDR